MCDNCSCGTDKATTDELTLPKSEAAVRTYKVEGMTCGHCKASVTEEVSQVPGVGTVDVDLPSGMLTISGDVSDDDVKAAVEEAGYRVVP